MASASKVNKFCSTREAAKLLGISLTTAQVMVEKGQLEAWKTSGGHRRILLESVEKLLNTRMSGKVAGPAGRDYCVLVAEDDDSLSKLYQRTIATWKLPLELNVAANGIEAMILLERTKPDLLVLDLKMPSMDGFQLLKSLRSRPEYNAMDIVVVTGMEPTVISKRGGLPPGVTILPKPVPWAQLRGFIQAAISRLQLAASR
jgi:excisionase family DNA binding protein